jgi:subtilisin family serine protease
MTSRHSRGRQLFLGTIDGDFHPRKPVKVWQARDNDGDDVLYVPGHVVIDQVEAPEGLGAVEPCHCPGYPHDEGIYHVPDAADGNVRDALVGLPDGERAVVSPIYGLMSCQAVMPTDDPERAPTLPPLPEGADLPGAGITVAVIDTGEAAPGGVRTVVADLDAIQGVVGADALQAFVAANGDRDELVDPRTLPGGTLEDRHPRLAWAAGHGQFVANLIKQVAPGVTIRHYGACSPMGFEREIEVAAAIGRAVEDRVDIINLSWCVFPLQHPPMEPDGLPRHPPILIRRATDRALDEGIAVVAAAGNAGSPDRTYPAAFDGVLSVGGLDRSGQRAYWSNYGKWVDAWAPSEHLWAEYVAGEELEENDPDGHIESWEDGQWASWSGTSFATALVSGQLAILMAATERRGPEAIASLKRTGYPVHGVAGGGKRIPIYLPYQYLP